MENLVATTITAICAVGAAAASASQFDRTITATELPQVHPNSVKTNSPTRFCRPVNISQYLCAGWVGYLGVANPGC